LLGHGSVGGILGWAMLGFAAAHTVVEWIVRAKDNGWSLKKTFTRENIQKYLKKDLSDLAARLVASFFFLIPFFLAQYFHLDIWYAIGGSFLFHAGYNALYVAGVLPEGWRVMSIFGSHKMQPQATPPSLTPIKPKRKAKIKEALFDWDGHFSLIREGWENIMAPFVAATLCGIELTDEEWDAITTSVLNNERLDNHFGSPAIKRLVDADRLTEKSLQWAYTMIATTKGTPTPNQFSKTCDEAERLGQENFQYVIDWVRGRNTNLPPREQINTENIPMCFTAYYRYKLLEIVRNKRLDKIRSGEAKPDDFLVKGTRRYLKILKERAAGINIISGSETAGVKEEITVLGLSDLITDVVGFEYGQDEDGQEMAVINKLDITRAFIARKLQEGAITSSRQVLVEGDGITEIEAGVQCGCFTVVTETADNKDIFERLEALKPDYKITGGTFTHIPEYVKFLTETEDSETLFTKLHGVIARLHPRNLSDKQKGVIAGIVYFMAVAAYTVLFQDALSVYVPKGVHNIGLSQFLLIINLFLFPRLVVALGVYGVAHMVPGGFKIPSLKTMKPHMDKGKWTAIILTGLLSQIMNPLFCLSGIALSNAYTLTLVYAPLAPIFAALIKYKVIHVPFAVVGGVLITSGGLLISIMTGLGSGSGFISENLPALILAGLTALTVASHINVQGHYLKKQAPSGKQSQDVDWRFIAFYSTLTAVIVTALPLLATGHMGDIFFDGYIVVLGVLAALFNAAINYMVKKVSRPLAAVLTSMLPFGVLVIVIAKSLVLGQPLPVLGIAGWLGQCGGLGLITGGSWLMEKGKEWLIEKRKRNARTPEEMYQKRREMLEAMAKRQAFIPIISYFEQPMLNAYNQKHRTHITSEELAKSGKLQAKLTIWGAKKYRVDGVTTHMELAAEPEAVILANLQDVTGVPQLVRYHDGHGPDFDTANNLTTLGIDWQNLKDVDFEKDGRLRAFGESVRLMKKKFGNKKPVTAFVQSPYTLACYLLGPENAMMAMYMEDKQFQKVMEYSTRFIKQYAEYLVNKGADAVVMLDPLISAGISPDHMKKFGVEPTNELSQAIRKMGALSGWHPCRPTINREGLSEEEILQLIRERLDVITRFNGDILSVDEAYPLDEAADKCEEHDTYVLGNIPTDDASVIDASPEAPGLMAKAVRALKKLMGTRHYLKGTSCDLKPGSEAVVAGMARAAHEGAAQKKGWRGLVDRWVSALMKKDNGMQLNSLLNPVQVIKDAFAGYKLIARGVVWLFGRAARMFEEARDFITHLKERRYDTSDVARVGDSKDTRRWLPFETDIKPVLLLPIQMMLKLFNLGRVPETFLFAPFRLFNTRSLEAFRTAGSQV
ncbi:MAG: hypothetical protein JW844_00015, partial [Candidatus Omnitrophica bacterium]|nr:hypothetical protein [Candidatus Omnitrophota bacterium]